MIKKISLLIVFLVAISGCAGKRMATLKVDEDGAITHNDSNYSLLQPSICPKQLAEAYFIKAQADMIKGVNNGATPKFKYTFVAVNVTPKRAYVFHPELGKDLPLAADEGNQFLFLHNIPTRVYFKDYRKKVVWKPRPNLQKIEEKKTFKGVPDIDLILTLESQ